MINAAPLVLLSYVKPDRAADFARHLVDRGLGDRLLLERGMMPILGSSPFKDDFERLWTCFKRELPHPGLRPAEAALIGASWPGVDKRVLAALRAEIGSPARWKATYDAQTAESLVEILWRRDYAPGVQLIRAAARTHPDPSSFNPAPAARGKRLERWV